MSGDRWGPEGPPDEAYSRVSRDLAQVSAGLATYLDGVPGELTGRFDCRVRPLTDDETRRVRRRSDDPGEHEYAVQPADPAAATLLVARDRYRGGAQVTLAFGRAAVATIPVCWCDACDERSEGLVDEVGHYLAIVTGGFHEFRRPHVPRHGELLHDGPWLEHGFEHGADRQSGASAQVRGELFEQTWPAWPPRG